MQFDFVLLCCAVQASAINTRGPARAAAVDAPVSKMYNADPDNA